MITIKSFEFEGAKYISCSKYVGKTWQEESFEYTDNDKLSTIISLLESSVNKINERA